MTDTQQLPWFEIGSTGGRIGPFWWINSNTIPIQYFGPDLPIRFVIWGSCGFNPRHMKLHLMPIEEPC